MFEQILDRLANPNIAFLLLTLGALALLSGLCIRSLFAGIPGIIAGLPHFAPGSLEGEPAGAVGVVLLRRVH